MHLVIFETGGNQRFIFRSNRLREITGASELIYRAGTSYVLNAVKDSGGPDYSAEFGDPLALRRAILTRPSAGGIEVIVATSGKTMLLINGRDSATNAKDIVRLATRTALREAPGLDLCGIAHEILPEEEREFGKAVSKAYQLLQRVQGQRAGADTRAQQLPIVAACRSTGGPAYGQIDETLKGKDGSSHGPAVWRDVSRSSFVQAEHFGRSGKPRAEERPGWRDRLNKIVDGTDIVFPPNPHRLEHDANLDWLGVVHVDGNGLGLIFQKFENYLPHGKQDYRTYIDEFRKFSIALECATEQAFIETLASKQPNAWRPHRHRGKKGDSPFVACVPLILGGDDITLICDGREALPFTINFLRNFEARTADSDIIREIMGRATNGRERKVTASAGVAIVKPHFPFHQAYQLSEELIKSAKRPVKSPCDGQSPRCSSIDFHILYDASFTELADIRSRLVRGNQGALFRLTAKPYAVLPEGEAAEGGWQAHASWHELEKRIHALRSNENGRRLLSSSQMHELREAYHRGYRAGDDQLALVEHRLDSKKLKDLLEAPRNGKPTLVRDCCSLGSQKLEETRFLDALDAAAFWGVDEPVSEGGADE